MLRKRHFTLIELLAVMAIIAILTAMLIGGINFAAKRADTAKTESVIAQMEMALEAFKADNGYYPVTSDKREIQFKVVGAILTLALVGETSPDLKFIGSNGRPYLELGAVSVTAEPMPLDAWGNGLIYLSPGTNNPQKYDLWSKGPDGATDTPAEEEDDITNWKK